MQKAWTYCVIIAELVREKREEMIKVTDVAYVRFRAPDLDKMETFLKDFGLERSARTDKALYMRACGPDHHVHVTELGDPEFVGMAFYAANEEDLYKLSQETGASEPEPIDEPGKGKKIRLIDPDGFLVDVVYGIQELEPIKIRNSYKPNSGGSYQRKGEFVRLEKGPTQCLRLGHVVIGVSNFKRSNKFYKSHFGFLDSDVCYEGNQDNIVLAFNRVDRGKEYVDHHALLTAPTGKPELGHIAFEVEDINAIHLGHEHLQSHGYNHSWGVGRHILGAQIFDYWFDPYGNRVEHWTDGDLLNRDSPTGVHPYSARFSTQWGVTESSRR